MKKLKAFQGKTVTVIGVGESGTSALRLLKRLGSRVRCSSSGAMDPKIQKGFLKKKIAFEENGHTEAFLKGSDFLVVSPGMRPTSLPLKVARANRIPVLSEIELASRCVDSPWVAITGTNGKTTTSTLLWDMLRRKGSCDLCGNIGKAFSRSVVENRSLSRVVEVSSFQLAFVDRFKPSLAVLLNLSPNHLDWHRSLRHYYLSKMNLLRNFTSRDTVVLNADDSRLLRYTRNLKVKKLFFSKKNLKEGLTISDNALVWVQNRRRKFIARLSGCKLVGDHSQENIMAASCAALFMGASARDIERSIKEAKPLPHRLEDLGQVKGVHFVNDSKSTTLESTRRALGKFTSRVVLVVGGRAKENSFKKLLPGLNNCVSHLVLYGEAAPKISEDLRNFRYQSVVSDFEEAILTAYGKAQRGEALLLSPMCASFDLFRSYEERGETFRRIFRKLKKSS